MGHFLEGLTGVASTPMTLKRAEALERARLQLVLFTLTYEVYSFPLGSEATAVLLYAVAQVEDRTLTRLC